MIRAPGARADLPEHDLAGLRAVPLHVGEPAGEAHRGDDVATHLQAAGQTGVVVIAQGEDLLADPFDLLADEWARPVLADVLEGDRAGRANRVVGELLAIDELLDADLGNGAEAGQRRFQLAVVLDPVRVHRTRSGDRLDDDRVADRRCRATAPVGRRRAHRTRRADTGGLDLLLHQPLVAERHRLVHIEPGHANRLAQPGGGDHQRLPQRLDEVDVVAFQRVQHRRHGLVLVEPVVDLDVRGERLADSVGHGVGMLVADTDHPRADRREAAREERHVAGVRRPEEHDIAHATATRTVEMISVSAASTASVSGSRTTM